MPKVYVKWGGKKFEVEANTNLEPLVLKSQLFELTGVLPDHQRVIIKGQQLKDEWGPITLQDGLTIMMIGNVAVDVAAAKKSENDAVAAEKEASTNPSKAGDKTSSAENLILPVGLRNLGNTCYMNACFQAYKTIPELVKSVKSYAGAENMTNRQSHLLIMTTKKLYDELSRMEKVSGAENKSHTPLFLLMTVHNAFPQFAARDSHGQYQQQDANECFSQILQLITSETNIPVGDGSAGIQDHPQSGPLSLKTSRIFETEFDVTLRCLENEEEPEQKSHESHMQLSCFLSQDVRYIQSGIKNRLTEEIEKHSDTLDRNVKYRKQSLISRLPEYLCVQMVRFFYKQKEQISAKILKDVKFPINLDMYDMCTPELQEKLQPMRDRYKIYDDHKLEELRRSKMDDNHIETADKNDRKSDTQLWSTSFENDPGSNNSGFYELKAVITHKGRSSDSGHYVAWIRLNNSTKWAMCDDDEVHPVSEEDVLKLSGGGDWHCAYLLIYGPCPLPVHDENTGAIAAESGAIETKMET